MALVHHGIGPSSKAPFVAWYEPRGFLVSFLSSTRLATLVENGRTGLVGFLIPAAALAVAIAFTTRSAVARTLAVAAVLGVGLCVYYGIEAPRVWKFFGWRGSAVMLFVALVTAVALTSPWLAASWKRLATPLRVAIYLPPAMAAVAMIRNATGTNPLLPFSFSPWPVVPVFGLELIVPVVGWAIALVALARAALGRGAGKALLTAGSLAALALAAALLARWVEWGFDIDWSVPAVSLCLGALVAMRSTGERSRPGAEPSPGRHAALGVVLLLLPVLVGMAASERDYLFTREVQARQVTDALERYFERQAVYPDSLDALVQTGLLTSIPRPRVGFALLAQPSFSYQNFGMSYLLEFWSPRWVQCGYSPPYAEDEVEEVLEDADASFDGAELEGAWSCPSRPPDLW
jgi:hypothetical protein